MPSAKPPAAVEAAVRAAAERGDRDEATTLVLREYGPELLGWLRDRLRCDATADEAFSLFVEDLWRSWPGFAWRCPARAWAYTLARNAANRQASSDKRRRQREVPVSRPVAQVLDQVSNRVRSSTPMHLRSEVRDELRRLRQELPEEDQTILVLRVDRRLPWLEIAQVMSGVRNPVRAELDREASRLRKRFQIVKTRLRELAADAGLLPDD